MAEYLAPGVYVEDSPNPPVIESVSSSTGGFLGVTERGPHNTPVFITSWNDYIENFAFGLSSPFMANSDLAYSVYGFFQNGGKRCYIVRVTGASPVAATVSKPELEATLTFTAKDVGVWGNKIKVEVIDTLVGDEGNFDMKVKVDTEVVETYSNLSNTITSETYWVDVLDSMSKVITGTGTLTKTDSPFTLASGSDGTGQPQDTDYVQHLSALSSVDDVNLICIPGQTSATVLSGLTTYCEGRKDVFAIIDAPKASDISSVKTLRKTLSCKVGALYYPWIRVSDPLSKTGKLRDCPTCGHVMGVYARIISERGVWKVPAGTEANIRGAIETVSAVNIGHSEVLNPLGINVIMSKPNYGIVIWGGRTLNPDSSMKYVSDVLLDINIKKSTFNGTQTFVFEPNDHKTWLRVKTTIESFLDTLWRDGALFGETSKQAYFVKCDEETNPEASRNLGRLTCQIGYANKKPAEFVIFKFSHQVSSTN